MFSCLRKKSSCTCVLERWNLTNTSWITTMLEHHTKMITEQKSVQLTSVSISLTLWQEVTRVEKSRPQLRRWDALRHELRKRWEQLIRAEKRWEELRTWQEVKRVGASWDEWRRKSLGRVEKSKEEGRDGTTLRAVEKSCNNWERAEKWWSQLKRDEAKWRTQRTELRSCVKFRGSSYRQNLFSGSYSSTLLIIGNFRQPACPGFTCSMKWCNRLQ